MPFLSILLLLCITELTVCSFTHPPQNVTGLNGATLTLSCYSDSQPYIVRWTRDGLPLASSPSLALSYQSGEATIVFSPLGYQHESVYRCIAYDERDQILFRSTPATVDVFGHPGFIEPPQSVAVTLGSMAVFTCVVGSDPPGSVAWVYRGAQLNSSAKYEVSTERLIVRNVSLADEGYYDCVASNAIGTVLASARLTISTEEHNSPLVSVAPSDSILTAEGNSLTLQCAASGNPIPSVLWLRNGSSVVDTQRVSINRLQGNSSLVFRAVVDSDDGAYVCYANNTQGSSSVVVMVMVQTLPRLVSVPNNATIVEGKAPSMPFICSAEGKPLPNVVIVNPSGSIVSFGGMWLPSNLLRNDEGRYSCVATNSIGRAEAHFTITVLAPPLITHVSEDTIQFIGEEVVLECQASGTPPLAITWRRGGVNETLSAVEGRLHLSNVDPSDGGMYVCSVTNTFGTDSAPVTVTVIEQPIVDIIPARVFATTGSTFTMTCQVSPPELLAGLTYQWYHRDIPLAGEQTIVLTIESAQSENEGTYSCEVNLETPLRASAEVVVGEIPIIIQAPPTEVTLYPGNSVRLDCIATGSPSPNLKWIYTDNFDQKSVIVDGAHYRQYSNGSLALLSVHRNLSGLYACVGDNGVGRAEATASVMVAGSPVAIAIKPPTLNLDQPGVVECFIVFTFPSPTISWTIPDSDRAPLSGSRLMFDRVSLKDEGEYTCTAENEYGISTVRRNITVYIPPVVSVASTSVVAYLDGPVSITCEGSGIPTPHLQWTTVSGDVVNGSTLYLSRVQLSDEGVYTCQAVNVLGSSSVTVLLQLQGAPPIQPIAFDVTRTTLQLSWQPPQYSYSVLYYVIQYRPKRDEFYAIANTSNTTVGLTDLEKGTEYLIAVKGIFVKEFVGERVTLEVTTLEDMPSAAPEAISVTPWYSQLDLTWQPPPIRERNGVIRGYNIYYRVTPFNLSVGATLPYSKVTVTSQSLILTDLLPEVSYQLSLQAFTSVGSGPNTTLYTYSTLRFPLTLVLAVTIPCGTVLLTCLLILCVCFCCCCCCRRNKKGEHSVESKKISRRNLKISGPIADAPPFIDPDNPGKFAVRNQAGDLVVLQPKIVTDDDIAPPPSKGETAQKVNRVKLKQSVPNQLYSEPQDSLAEGREMQVIDQAFDGILNMDHSEDESPYATSHFSSADNRYASGPHVTGGDLDALVTAHERVYSSVSKDHVERKREQKREKERAKVERKGLRSQEAMKEDSLPLLTEVNTKTKKGQKKHKEIDKATAGLF